MTKNDEYLSYTFNNVALMSYQVSNHTLTYIFQHSVRILRSATSKPDSFTTDEIILRRPTSKPHSFTTDEIILRRATSKPDSFTTDEIIEAVT